MLRPYYKTIIYLSPVVDLALEILDDKSFISIFFLRNACIHLEGIFKCIILVYSLFVTESWMSSNFMVVPKIRLRFELSYILRKKASF